MKISLYSLSLADKKPAEIIKSAQEAGCEGIEWWCHETGHVAAGNPESSAKAVAELMKDSGLRTAGLAPYFKYNEKPGEVKRIFNAAALLNAPLVRCHSFAFDGTVPVAELRQKQRAWLESVVVPAAEEYKVKMVVEQHHYNICCTPNACRELVEGLPPARVGIIYDPGNSLVEGYTHPEYALSVIGEYLAHVHVKSAAPAKGEFLPKGRKYPLLWGGLSSGDLDWEQIIRSLSKRGYNGFLSLEALDGRPSQQKIAEDIPFLRNIIKHLPLQ